MVPGGSSARWECVVERREPHARRSAAVAALAALLVTVGLVWGGGSRPGALLSFAGADQTALYDVPNSVEQRSRMHFPQAEAGWLDSAAAGKIGDEAKSQDQQARPRTLGSVLGKREGQP